MFYFSMAGVSSRFTKQGYKNPKYYLDVGNINLFQASLLGFSKYFDSDQFCFIYLEKFIDGQTILNWANDIGLKKSNCVMIPLSYNTRGQADTVRLGITALHSSTVNEEEVIVFNIDTIYRNFRKAKTEFGPYLDVTSMPGDHWSFVLPTQNKSEQIVAKVTEKNRISDYCSVGLYQFVSGFEYLDAYQNTYAEASSTEHYVAPMYQTIIDRNAIVHFRNFPATQFDFLGTPEEYETYLRNNSFEGKKIIR